MKHLIIYTHLNPDSFTRAVANKAEEVLIEKGDTFKTIDLYKDKFNPVLQMPDIEYNFYEKEAPEDVKHYQELISWADNLIFVFPLWWSQMPAMLKGFIDRTFTNGFAYLYTDSGEEALLSDKTAHVFINTGQDEEHLTQSGTTSGLENIYINSLFGFCGIKSEITFFSNVPNGTAKLRENYLKSIKEILN